MRVAVAGGHGKIGRLLIRDLVARGDEVVSLDRNPAYADEIRGWGAEPVACDLETASEEEVAGALGEVDAVVFAAGAGPGSGPDRKWAMDRDGAVKLMAAAGANERPPLRPGQLDRRRPRCRGRRYVRGLPARQGRGRRRARRQRPGLHDHPANEPHRRARRRDGHRGRTCRAQGGQPRGRGKRDRRGPASAERDRAHVRADLRRDTGRGCDRGALTPTGCARRSSRARRSRCGPAGDGRPPGSWPPGGVSRMR